jgi:precorrin-6Y C5,15-methyltransferase (decarboxylating)
MRIVHGIAPDVLTGEPSPAGVFLGGSGGELDGILDAVFDRLVPEGVVVANFVGLESLTRTLDRLRGAGWTVRVSQVQVSHAEPLAGLTTLVPLRPVWIVRAARPRNEIEEGPL